MQIRMENIQTLTPEVMKGFLDGSGEIKFTGQSQAERYAWIQTTLTEQEYFALSKKHRGIVRALLSQLAGLSLPQITRLIRRYPKRRDSATSRNAATICRQVHNGGFGVAD